MSRQVIVGVGGGIAAYKATTVVRELSRAGFSVSVLPTKASLNLVGETTWAALSGNPVYVDPFVRGGEVAHVELARQAELIVIVAATADLLGRIRVGLAPDMLGNVLLASSAPVLIAPAMHTAMWNNPATQDNVKQLKERGMVFVGPVSGALSSGDSGIGRLASETDIVTEALKLLSGSATDTLAPGPVEGSELNENIDLSEKTLAGLNFLISAGGTRENLDPVRFIGNRSSGIFGAHLAIAAHELGAQVTVLAAHLSASAQQLLARHPKIKLLDTPNAESMLEAVEENYAASDIIMMAAAVADYRPRSYAENKLKKTAADSFTLELVKTPDILAHIAKKAQAETENQIESENQIETGSLAGAESRGEAESQVEVKPQGEITPQLGVKVQVEAEKRDSAVGEGLANIGQSKAERRDCKLILGFAAETGAQAAQLAQEKARRKGADVIFFNQVGLSQGFGQVDTKVTALDRQGQAQATWQGEKVEIAPQMLQYVAEKYAEKYNEKSAKKHAKKSAKEHVEKSAEKAADIRKELPVETGPENHANQSDSAEIDFSLMQPLFGEPEVESE